MKVSSALYPRSFCSLVKEKEESGLKLQESMCNYCGILGGDGLLCLYTSRMGCVGGDRGVDFFRRVGGMRLPNSQGSNGRTSCGGRATVLRCSEMHPEQFMPNLSALKSSKQMLCVICVATMLNCKD